MAKMQKELNLALTKFDSNFLVRQITDFIITDLKKYYQKLHNFIKP